MNRVKSLESGVWSQDRIRLALTPDSGLPTPDSRLRTFLMKIYDISVPIAPGVTPVYEGDPGIEVASWTAIERGDAANVSALSLGAHTGTHVDAPAHFIEGAPGVISLPLDALMGEARVVEIPSGARAVEEGHVRDGVPEGCPRVLFKTRNSAFWDDPRGRFREDFAYIEPGAARALVSRG